MEKKVKVVNYSAEATAQMVADYTSGVTVEKIAEALGKTVRSVTMKLVREKVYKKAERTAKDGSPVVHKDALADAIGKVLSLTEPEITGLSRTPKTALKTIFAALANSKPL